MAGINVGGTPLKGTGDSQRTLQCDACGESFIRYRSRVRSELHYCSHKCSSSAAIKHPLGHSHSWISRGCETCGAQFRTQVKTIARGGGRFCSRKCNPSYAPKEPASSKHRRYNLKANYGITIAEYDELQASQEGRCAICGRLPGGRHRRLVVDHDHTSGHVRALLCVTCNWALGWFQDDPEVIWKAAAYLDRYRRVDDNQADAMHIARYVARYMNGGARK